VRDIASLKSKIPIDQVQKFLVESNITINKQLKDNKNGAALPVDVQAIQALQELLMPNGTNCLSREERKLLT